MFSSMRTFSLVSLSLSLFASPLRGQEGRAGAVRESIARRRAERGERDQLDQLDDGSSDRARASVPSNVRVVRDVGYGVDLIQRYDVYIPAGATNAPVVMLVHGGGWRTGDKAMKTVVENKVKHWAAAGIIVISVNYRLLPTDPLDQARDLARALTHAQSHLASWGGDPAKVVLMGHSAGAHLVALLATEASIPAAEGVRGWLGSVILDSAVLDVVDVMEHPHLPLYTAAFGPSPKFWRLASPYHHLVGGGTPMLVVCSSLRRDSCPAAKKFVAKATSVATSATLVEEAMSHREINDQLGVAGAYTDQVDDFLRRLDGSFAKALARSTHAR